MIIKIKTKFLFSFLCSVSILFFPLTLSAGGEKSKPRADVLDPSHIPVRPAMSASVPLVPAVDRAGADVLSQSAPTVSAAPVKAQKMSPWESEEGRVMYQYVHCSSFLEWHRERIRARIGKSESDPENEWDRGRIGYYEKMFQSHKKEMDSSRAFLEGILTKKDAIVSYVRVFFATYDPTTDVERFLTAAYAEVNSLLKKKDQLNASVASSAWPEHNPLRGSVPSLGSFMSTSSQPGASQSGSSLLFGATTAMVGASSSPPSPVERRMDGESSPLVGSQSVPVAGVPDAGTASSSLQAAPASPLSGAAPDVVFLDVGKKPSVSGGDSTPKGTSADDHSGSSLMSSSAPAVAADSEEIGGDFEHVTSDGLLTAGQAAVLLQRREGWVDRARRYF